MKERIIRAVAGTMVLLSLTLAYIVHVYWLGLAAFVGLNLLQSSVIQFCPLEKVLEMAGVSNGGKSVKKLGEKRPSKNQVKT